MQSSCSVRRFEKRRLKKRVDLRVAVRSACVRRIRQQPGRKLRPVTTLPRPSKSLRKSFAPFDDFIISFPSLLRNGNFPLRGKSAPLPDPTRVKRRVLGTAPFPSIKLAKKNCRLTPRMPSQDSMRHPRHLALSPGRSAPPSSRPALERPGGDATRLMKKPSERLSPLAWLRVH